MPGPLTNFPGGLSSFGIPLLGSFGTVFPTGSVFWVNSSHPLASDDANQGSMNGPFKSVNFAFSRCVDDANDLILVDAGHVETISLAAGLKANKRAVTVVNVAAGSASPLYRFTNQAATCAISAASVKMLGVVATTTVDGVTNPFVITGNDCTLDLQWRDGSAVLQAITAVLATAVSRLTLALRYIGFAGSTSVRRALGLDGCTNVRAEMDTYGYVGPGSAWVQMINNPSTDVVVTGRMATYRVVNGSRDVVDTIGGSSWGADILDTSAGQRFNGGNAFTFGPTQSDGPEEKKELITLSNLADHIESLRQEVREMMELVQEAF